MSFILRELYDKFNIDYNRLPYTLLDVEFERDMACFDSVSQDESRIIFKGTYVPYNGAKAELGISVHLNRIDYKIFKDYDARVEDFDDARFIKALQKNVVIYDEFLEDNYHHIICYNILGGINRHG